MTKRAAALLIGGILLLTGCAVPFLSSSSDVPPGEEEPVPTPVITPRPTDERKTEEEFVYAVSRALQARWDVSAEYSSDDLAAMSAAEYQAYLRRCVEAEREEIGSIIDYRFMDSDLAELAQAYYYALSLQYSGAEYARTTALNEYNRTWVLGYYYRVSAVYDLMREFSLKVEEEYASRLAELTAAHYEAKKQVAFRGLIDSMYSSLVYEEDPAGTDGAHRCFTGWIVNTTEYDILSLSVEVSFLDGNGNIIAQASDWISNLRAGQGARSIIYAAVGEYAGMEYTISVYQ